MTETETTRVNRGSATDRDVELVLRMAEGDEDAFERLVEKYAHSILNTAYQYIGDRDEAEDVAQKVFVVAWQDVRSLKEKSKFSAWLYRIAVNECLDHGRRKRSRPRIAIDLLPDPESPDTSEIELERARRKDILRKALDLLPDRQRLAIVLSKFEGRSYSEIAQIMGVSVSTVESLIFRAKAGLRKRLLPLKMRGEL
jgi:RNA polymerase sigma factor (sigma-70 family)